MPVARIALKKTIRVEQLVALEFVSSPRQAVEMPTSDYVVSEMVYDDTQTPTNDLESSRPVLVEVESPVETEEDIVKPVTSKVLVEYLEPASVAEGSDENTDLIDYAASDEIELPKPIFDEATGQFVEVTPDEAEVDVVVGELETMAELDELPPIAEEFALESMLVASEGVIVGEEAAKQHMFEGVDVRFGAKELMPLHELTQQKIELLSPETNEIVETLLEQLDVVLQSPESPVVASAETTEPVEERVVELLEEVLIMLEIPHNQEQLRHIVALLIQYYQNSAVTQNEPDETVIEVGTREFFTKAQSFLQYIQSLFEPIQTLIGRTVLLASKSA